MQLILDKILDQKKKKAVNIIVMMDEIWTWNIN